MSEKGIIMAGQNPVLILQGRKTQTRRLIRPQPDEDGLLRVSPSIWLDTSERVYRPLGTPGETLAVLEKWRTHRQWDRLKPSRLPIIDESLPDPDIDWAASPSRNLHGKWRPSIHLPRRFARMRIDILAVRVERLQNITEDAAKAEGVNNDHSRRWPSGLIGTMQDVYRRNYAALWESLHGAGSWKSNPWIWVYDFKKE